MARRFREKGRVVTFVVLGPAGVFLFFVFFFCFGADSVLYVLVAVDWEGGELSEDEEGQVEVIRALPPKDRDAPELLSVGSLRESGMLDPIPEGTMLRTWVLFPLFFLFFIIYYLFCVGG